MSAGEPGNVDCEMRGLCSPGESRRRSVRRRVAAGGLAGFSNNLSVSRLADWQVCTKVPRASPDVRVARHFIDTMKSEMGATPKNSPGNKSGSTIRFTVTGLIAFCSSLVGTSILVTHYMEGGHQTTSENRPASSGAVVQSSSAKTEAAWGDLMTLDVDIQQPEEYVSFDTTTVHFACESLPSVK